MAKSKTFFECRECGHQTSKWLGRCPECQAWNTLEERVRAPEAKTVHQSRTFRLPDTPDGSSPIPLVQLDAPATPRQLTGLPEFDRVLGGGLVFGAVTLIGGDPGIGKSTLLLQALQTITQRASPRRALYVSGEESAEQVRLRARRLGIDSEGLLFLSETRVDAIAAAVQSVNPAALVIDSIQSVYDPSIESAPGSVSQIREVAARFLYLAKGAGVPTLLVGHVTKDGSLAGPRVLEHLVDTVLYFETATGHSYRILRAHKNRFGSTNEIGVFEMSERGLRGVENPSELFLSERPESAPGSVVLPAIEGTRPVLVEVQALVSSSGPGTPRRTCLGFDQGRAALLAAVLERTGGLQLGGSDIFINVVGGMNIHEPAADLAVLLALASSLKNRPLTSRTVAFGEVGLAGEIRAVTQTEARLNEAAKLGFNRAVLPAASQKKSRSPENMRANGALKVEGALELAFPS